MKSYPVPAPAQLMWDARIYFASKVQGTDSFQRRCASFKATRVREDG
jgi:hypothetical protein